MGRKVLNPILNEEILRTSRTEGVYRQPVERPRHSRGPWTLFWLAMSGLVAITVRQTLFP
jgi:hypothetical protein